VRRIAAPFTVLLVLSSCNKPSTPAIPWKPGEVYSLQLTPKKFVVCKILEIDNEDVLMCLFKQDFERRPTAGDLANLSTWVPLAFSPKTMTDSEPVLISTVPPTQAELDHLHNTKHLSPSGKEAWKEWDPQLKYWKEPNR
jgi:hypothetical protein